MSEKRYKRFYVSESENQFVIYDNEGLDDYYHLGDDERDVKGICNLLNSLAEENAEFLQAITESAVRTSQLRKQVKEQQEHIKEIERQLKEKEKERKTFVELREDFNLDKYIEMKKQLERLKKAEFERNVRF